MSARGGFREGAGRRPKAEGKTRVHIGASVDPDTKTWIDRERDRTGCSTGELIDKAIEVLADNPQWQFKAKSPEPVED